jgi:hypothetical protein
MAIKSLDALPMDGLSAGLLVNREEILRWKDEAPLRLVAAALVDLGNSARTADLKRQLSMVVGDWSRWWKRVQPALKESDQFSYRSGATELKTSPADIQPISWDALAAPSKLVRPRDRRSKATGDSSVRLAEWVTWIQSSLPDTPPGPYPPKALPLVLQNLHVAIVPTATDNLLRAIEHYLINTKKLTASSLQAWLSALLAALQRQVQLLPNNEEEVPLPRIVALTVRILETGDLREGEDLVSWLADYVSRTGHGLHDAAMAFLSVAGEHSSGMPALLKGMREALLPSTRIDLWQLLVQVETDEMLGFRAGHWLRILDPAERVDVLSSLFVVLRDEESIRRAGSLLQREWKSARAAEKRHLFKAVLLAWLLHDQLRSELRAMIEANMTQDQEGLVPDSSHAREFREIALSLAEGEIERARRADDHKMVALQRKLEESEAALDRAEKRARYLGGELQRSSRVAELDISRDAIEVLGESLQRLFVSSDSPVQKMQDAKAGITLAIMALGAEVFGEVGERVPFDPQVHRVPQAPASGSPVRVIAPGLRYTRRTVPPLVLIPIQALLEE